MRNQKPAAYRPASKLKEAPAGRLATALLILILAGLTTLFFLLRYPPSHLGGRNLKNEADRFESPSLLLTDRSLNPLAYLEPDRKAAPASLTKMMTVLVALEKTDDLSALTQVDTESYLRMVESNASMAGFFGQEQVTVRDLIYGTMLPSGGEAASSLAISVAGDEDHFVRLMNQKAQQLNMHRTHFANVTGLDDPEQYSTAGDLARLLSAALDNPDFRTVFTTLSYRSTPGPDHPDGVYMESSVIRAATSYDLLPTGVTLLGGKSGITDQAGRCWASLLEKDGREYLAITMGGDINQADPPVQLVDTARLAELLP